MEKICKNCKHFGQIDWGVNHYDPPYEKINTCLNDVMTSESKDRDAGLGFNNDAISQGGTAAWGNDYRPAILEVSENFGCIHFDEKE